jgi:hypothetical protein
MLSIGVFYWRPDQGRLGFYPGKFTTTTVSQRLDLPEARRATGILITLPTGGSNRLEIGYWSSSASGSTRVTRPLNIYAANVRTGELVASEYKLANFRVSWNYLTYPVPAFDAKLRIKTFWEVQHTRIKPTVRFPESNTPDATVGPKQSITWPGVGIGMEFVPSNKFRIDARISGMALPGKSRYADAEVALVGTIGSLEIYGGGKGFHFRTTPNSEAYQQAYIWGPMAGVRWVFK